MNKTALITGGSRGIGFGIAECLAKIGFDLAINGQRTENECIANLEKLRSYGVKVIYCQGNVGDADGRKAILNKVKTEFGYLNLFVSNAGVAPLVREDILISKEESFDRLIDINLKGVYFLTQSIANWMIDLKTQNPDFEANIVINSSISSTTAGNSRGEYCVSKAGLSMVAQLFAVRLGEFDIPVFEVRPGIIKTDMTSVVADKYEQLLQEGLAVQKRWGTPEDVGKVVAAIAQNSFAYSTGQVFVVDGGLTLGRF
jgi:3-oxoacyl-[acyl-carrier protein] reductase